MNFKKFLLGLFCVIPFVFSSCADDRLYISTMTLSPAEIDMSSYRNVAVTSTKQWGGSFANSGFVRFTGNGGSINVRHQDTTTLPVDLASYVNKVLVQQISDTNYFTRVIAPPEADFFSPTTNLSSLGISRDELLAKNNVNAIIDTTVTDMKFDEYIESEAVYTSKTETDAKGNKKTVRVFDHWKYKLHQDLSIVVELKITDIARNTTIASKQLSGSTSKVYDIANGIEVSRSPRDEFVNLLNKMSNSIAVKMIPHYTYKAQEAMANKPKLASAEAAYDCLRRGMNDAAYQVFSELWKLNKHVPSGYNAALLLHGKGEIEAAITLMQEVYDHSKNVNALLMLSELKSAKATWDSAQSQL